jgi:hypothetical protein
VLALTLCAATLLLGCSSGDDGDDGGGDAEDTTTTPADAAVDQISESLRDSFGDELDADDAECVAVSLVDELGDEAALEVNETPGLLDLSDEQQTAVTTAFNECIPGAALAGSVAATVYGQFGSTEQPADTVVECFGTELDGRTGDLILEGEQAEADGALPATLLEVADACVPTEVVAIGFADSFEQGGLSAEAAACVANAVVENLTIEQLISLQGNEGAAPPEVQQVITDATLACG